MRHPAVFGSACTAGIAHSSRKFEERDLRSGRMRCAQSRAGARVLDCGSPLPLSPQRPLPRPKAPADWRTPKAIRFSKKASRFSSKASRFAEKPTRFDGKATCFVRDPSLFFIFPSRFADDPTRFSFQATRFDLHPTRLANDPTRFSHKATRFTRDPSRFASKATRFSEKPTGFTDKATCFALDPNGFSSAHLHPSGKADHFPLGTGRLSGRMGRDGNELPRPLISLIFLRAKRAVRRTGSVSRHRRAPE